MGDDYVRSMCHDIEDPTFDATAVATNPQAQVRPVHRPAAPRRPDRTPHCAWTVVIDDSHPEATPIPALAKVAASRAATLELDPIDPTDEGAARLLRSARLRPRLLGVLALGPGADRRRGLPPDAPAQPGLPPRGPRPRSHADAGHRDRHQAAGRHRRHRRRADPPRARHRRPRHARPAPAAQPGGVRRRGVHATRPSPSRAVPPTRTAAGSPSAARTLCGRSRPRSARSTRTSTSRSRAHATDWTATVVRRDEAAPDVRRGGGDQVQHRRVVRLRAPAGRCRSPPV